MTFIVVIAVLALTSLLWLALAQVSALVLASPAFRLALVRLALASSLLALWWLVSSHGVLVLALAFVSLVSVAVDAVIVAVSVGGGIIFVVVPIVIIIPIVIISVIVVPVLSTAVVLNVILLAGTTAIVVGTTVVITARF